jgi:hypothetical protein
MPQQSFLLRFESRIAARSVLESVGMVLDTEEEQSGIGAPQAVTVQLAFGDGTVRRPTGETVSFEGEAMAITRTTPGYHLLVHGTGKLPPALMDYVVVEGAQSLPSDP